MTKCILCGSPINKRFLCKKNSLTILFCEKHSRECKDDNYEKKIKKRKKKKEEYRCGFCEFLYKSKD